MKTDDRAVASPPTPGEAPPHEEACGGALSSGTADLLPPTPGNPTSSDSPAPEMPAPAANVDGFAPRVFGQLHAPSRVQLPNSSTDAPQPLIDVRSVVQEVVGGFAPAVMLTPGHTPSSLPFAHPTHNPQPPSPPLSHQHAFAPQVASASDTSDDAIRLDPAQPSPEPDVVSTIFLTATPSVRTLPFTLVSDPASPSPVQEVRRREAARAASAPERPNTPSSRAAANPLNSGAPHAAVESIQSRSILAGSFAPNVALAQPDNPEPPVSSAISLGAVFAGKYAIKNRIAAGGMGTVFVAKQLSTDRYRALKTMHASVLSSQRLPYDALNLFAKEARIGAKILSDHVVDVVDAGIDENGVPWLAMELLLGLTLDERLKQEHMLSAAETLTILEQLCHGVGAAHAERIVHRDLKPANIFLARARRPGPSYTVKVLDFGIAAWAQDNSTDHFPGGTPRWGAPEQFEHNNKIHPSCDVWAIGLIAFNMLTGHYYWSSPTGNLASLLREWNAPLPAASMRAREVGAQASLPVGFDEWFSRCVARDPSRRFADANTAFSDLKSILTKRPPIRVFISYCSKDAELCEQFLSHLSVLKRSGLVAEWCDRRILPGQGWKDEVDKNLEDAELVLLLVSSDFVASDYCFAVEMHRALERQLAGSAEVVPVIIRACDWSTAPFSKLRALPTAAKPIMSWENRDEGWLDVIRGIRLTLAIIEQRRERG